MESEYQEQGEYPINPFLSVLKVKKYNYIKLKELHYLKQKDDRRCELLNNVYYRNSLVKEKKSTK
jgi:hypothetical protein